MVTISIQDLFLGGAVFTLLFVMQTLLWHFTVVPRQLLVLFVFYLVGPLPFYFLGILQLPGFVLALLLSSNYISAFPVLQASSPSIVVLEFLFRKKRATEKDIVTYMSQFRLVEDRLSDLEKGALVVAKGKDYALTPKGDLLASFFILFRKGLNLPQGGG